MQTINNQFLKFLNNIFSQSSIKSSTFDDFNIYFNLFRNYQYIPLDFDTSLDDYPIYPIKYKYYDSLQITSNKSFSSQKIISTSLPNSNYLNKSNIFSDLVSINSKVEKIPTDINNIKFTHLTQKIFIDDDYLNSYMFNLQQNEIYENDYIFYDLMFNPPPTYHQNLDRLNVIHIESLYLILFQIYSNFFSIKNVLFTYFYNLDTTEQILTSEYLTSSLTSFLSSSDQADVYEDMSRFILKTNFNMIMPVNNILTLVKNYIIEDEIPNFITSFTTFLNNNYDNMLTQFFNTSFNKFNNILFYHIFQDFIQQDIEEYINISILKTELNSKLCDDYITTLLSSINKYELQKYLFPTFLYSGTPIKLINIIPQFIKQFILEHFLTITEYENDITESKVNSIFYNLLDNLNPNYLNTYFSTLDINDIIIENNISSTVSSMFCNSIFQEYFESDEFNSYIISLLENIYELLYSNKLIQYNQNWFNNIELIKAFFKSFLLTYINYNTDTFHSNQIFPDLEDTLNYYFSNNTISYSGTSTQLSNIISQQYTGVKIKSDIYNLTKNIFYGHLNKTIYNKILTFYIN